MMNKEKEVKKGRHSQESLLGISLLYVVHQIRKQIPYFTKAQKSGAPRLQHSQMTPSFSKAFTLIELLVVVLIIGILAAVALPGYQTAVEKSRAAEALINLKHAQQAFVLHHLQTSGSDISELNKKDIIDISGGVWDTEGNYYCTDKFFYQWSGRIVGASRCTPNAACDHCQENTGEYALTLLTPYAGEGWENNKSCEYATNVGFKVCKSLEGQGFEIDEL